MKLIAFPPFSSKSFQRVGGPRVGKELEEPSQAGTEAPKPNPPWCTWKIIQSRFWADSSCHPHACGAQRDTLGSVHWTTHRDAHGQISNVAPGEQKAAPNLPVSTTQVFQLNVLILFILGSLLL